MFHKVVTTLIQPGNNRGIVAVTTSLQGCNNLVSNHAGGKGKKRTSAVLEPTNANDNTLVHAHYHKAGSYVKTAIYST